MRTTTLAAALLAVGALAACGTSTSGTAGTAPAPGAPLPGGTSSAPATTESLACADIPRVAATLTRSVHYVALDVGTTNDSTHYYDQIDQAVAGLRDLSARCRPAAVASVTALAASVDALEAGMTPGTDAAAVSTDAALLAAVRADGITAYRALTLPTVGWENTPENRVTG